MANEAPRHPLRDVLADPEAVEPVEWLTAVVQSRQIATAPYTVTLQLADGTVTGALRYLGWFTPTVNDVVEVIRQGPRMFVLGPSAPANLAPAASVTPTPPPAPPGAPPSRVTKPVAPVDMAYWGQGAWRTDVLIQGGPNGYRPFWFYGGGIAAAKGSGTIVGGTIYMQREASSHGVNGGANVRLGTHGQSTRGGSGSSAHANVAVVGQLIRGQDAALPLSAAQIAALNAGAAGLGLEPGGTSYSSPDYLKVLSGGASGQLALIVET